MNLYAESSAVLAWLMGEQRGEEVRSILSRAHSILASDLTLVECDRVLIRASVLHIATEAESATRRAYLNRAASHWSILRLGPEIVERARNPFPAEPIRTLDALHVASLIFARSVLPDTVLLSLDLRIRSCGEVLGFELLPE